MGGVQSGSQGVMDSWLWLRSTPYSIPNPNPCRLSAPCLLARIDRSKFNRINLAASAGQARFQFPGVCACVSSLYVHATKVAGRGLLSLSSMKVRSPNTQVVARWQVFGRNSPCGLAATPLHSLAGWIGTVGDRLRDVDVPAEDETSSQQRTGPVETETRGIAATTSGDERTLSHATPATNS
jgi:hypothetical protein